MINKEYRVKSAHPEIMYFQKAEEIKNLFLFW